jgi:serine protease Do
MRYLLQDGYKSSLVYDYSLLKIQTKPKTQYQSLKIGSWSDINDGDVVYSCGYPLGIKQRFISQGLFSTKWIDSIPLFNKGKLIETVSRNVAWLDLTMNKGNSGGAIIKLGETPEDDKVIGIASFILNPYANTSEQIAKYLPRRGIDMSSDGISQNQLMKILFEAISKNSIGVSGTISIDYVSEVLKIMKP